MFYNMHVRAFLVSRGFWKCPCKVWFNLCRECKRQRIHEAGYHDLDSRPTNHHCLPGSPTPYIHTAWVITPNPFEERVCVLAWIQRVWKTGTTTVKMQHTAAVQRTRIWVKQTSISATSPSIHCHPHPCPSLGVTIGAACFINMTMVKK